MKYAMTMDGKIANLYRRIQMGDRAKLPEMHVQKQRLKYTGIMAGVGTVLADDPMLTCRLENGRNPVRIICDSHLRTPLNSRIVKTASTIPTIFATSSKDQQKDKRNYEDMGCKVLDVPEKNGHIDLNRLMELLGAAKIDSILLEGGGTLKLVSTRKRYCSESPDLYSTQTFWGRKCKDTDRRKRIS